MPGVPAVSRGTLYSKGTDQTSHADSHVHLSAEEELAAEESLSTFCKPVELYNILQQRAKRNPSFLQRCLDYKIKAKHNKRIQMTVSLAQSVDETQTVFPLSICLARLISDVGVTEYSAVYRISRICILRNSSGTDGNTQVQANFMLPEVKKLGVAAKSGSHVILFVSTVENPNLSSELNASLMPLDPTSNAASAEEYCLCGKVSLESLYDAWDNSPNFRLGQRAEKISTVDLLPCILKSDFLGENKSISIKIPSNSENLSTSKQLQITISAEEFGAKEKPPYLSYVGSEVLSSPFSGFYRMKEGNVIFHYRYYDNKLKRTEVTEGFSCPFCLIRCASFKGLRHHLTSSHDLFNFEFWESNLCQAVNVSVKNDIWRFEIVADGVAPRTQTFFFCAKPLKRGTPNGISFENPEDVPPLVIEAECPAGDTENLDNADGNDIVAVSNATVVSDPDPVSVQAISEHDNETPAVPQIAGKGKSSLEKGKSSVGKGKSSIEPSDPRMSALLRKRQFYHSQTGQPMALEQVLSDQDSEDEVDHEMLDYEDQRLLDHLVDVDTNDKQIMLMWNSFVRRQRMVADGHVPWACVAFSTSHGPELVQSNSLAWRWRLFMIKLWNHNLLDAKSFNECSLILEQYLKQN